MKDPVVANFATADQNIQYINRIYRESTKYFTKKYQKNIMKKFLSVIAIAAIFTLVLPSCSHNNDFEDVVINQIDEVGSEETGTGVENKENERPGGS